MMLVRPLLALYPCLLLVPALSQTLPGQYRKYEGMDVAVIRFDPVRQPLEPEELHSILPLKMHEPLRMSVVHASIERLWATGRYADIQVDARPYGAGVAVTFLTKESWFVGDVAVEGRVSSPPSVAQLENAARLDLGTPFTDAMLNAAVARTAPHSGGERPLPLVDCAVARLQLRRRLPAGEHPLRAG